MGVFAPIYFSVSQRKADSGRAAGHLKAKTRPHRNRKWLFSEPSRNFWEAARKLEGKTKNAIQHDIMKT